MQKSSAYIFLAVAGAVFALGKCTAGPSQQQQVQDSEAALRYAELKAQRVAVRADSVELEQSRLQLAELNIADPALAECLQNAVTQALNYGVPLAAPTDLQELECPHKSIADLRGLEHFQSLKQLDLSSNKITDAAPLKNLRTLVQLDLSNNQVQSIWALQSLDQLTSLNLYNNPVRDLYYVSGMQSLEKLDYKLTNKERCDDLVRIRRALSSVKASLNIPYDCMDEFGERSNIGEFE